MILDCIIYRLLHHMFFIIITTYKGRIQKAIVPIAGKLSSLKNVWAQNVCLMC